MKIQEIKERYSINYPIYDKAMSILLNLLKSLINSESIQTHAIIGRTKSISSFIKKAEKYENPELFITDYIGLRVITYVQSDVEKICNIIEREFDIDQENYTNKNKDLGIDKIGYRSIHYIAKLKSSRAELTEYKDMTSLCFEIQVRTLLQHTWAEIEHDRKYKFSGVLPEVLQRRLNLVSAVLEVADNEFNTIASDIDEYNKIVAENIGKGNYETELNSSSLFEYLKQHKEMYSISDGWEISYQEMNNEIIKELSDFGINDISDLSKIELDEYFKEIKDYAQKTNFIAILRDLMIINDHEKYFNNCWNHHWNIFDRESSQLLRKFGVPIKKIISDYELFDSVPEDAYEAEG